MGESQHEEPSNEGVHKSPKAPAIKKKIDISDYVTILKFCIKKTPQTSCLRKRKTTHRILICCWWKCKMGNNSAVGKQFGRFL